MKSQDTRLAGRPASYKLKANDQSGVAVLITILLIGITLSIVFTLSLIFVSKIKSAGDTKNSIAAVYATDSFIEWCLYANRIGVTTQPVMTNGAAVVNGNNSLPFNANGSDCLISPIKVTGTYRGVTRSFEVSF